MITVKQRPVTSQSERRVKYSDQSETRKGQCRQRNMADKKEIVVSGATTQQQQQLQLFKSFIISDLFYFISCFKLSSLFQIVFSCSCECLDKWRWRHNIVSCVKDSHHLVLTLKLKKLYLGWRNIHHSTISREKSLPSTWSHLAKWTPTTLKHLKLRMLLRKSVRILATNPESS